MFIGGLRSGWGEGKPDCAGVLNYDGRRFVSDIGAWGAEMAKKITRSRPWTKEELRMLKTLAREQTRTTVIARKLKRSVSAVYLRASTWVMLGEGRGSFAKCGLQNAWERPL
jgi:hypothetical protein